MASRAHHPVLPRLDAMEPGRPTPALASELLEEIFLRVASPADLARASAACVSFRCLISNPCFLRRYRSVHPPQLLGFLNANGFYPVEATHPSAAVARAVARTADFSFDFLPRPTREWYGWRRCNSRDGRVLFRSRSNSKSDLVVCDPLSRRYLLLPPITDDLLASVELKNHYIVHSRESFISSGGTSGGIEDDTSFRVILWMQSSTRLGVFVFSSKSGRWSVIMSTNCDVLGLSNIKQLASGQCAYDCFYWTAYDMNTLIKLNMNTMQFCTIDLPPDHYERKIVIAESGESKVVMFSLSCEGRSVDYYTLSRNDSENSHEWQLMSTIPLPADYNIYQCFTGSTEGYIFLGGVGIEQNRRHSTFFSLDIKSFKIERVSKGLFAVYSHPYFGFPPSMSPIRIRGYGED